MNKLITTAFLLMALASVSYGQELAYLHCVDIPDQPAYDRRFPSRILVLNNEDKMWDVIFLRREENLENLSEDEIASRIGDINGENSLTDIISTTSRSYTLDFFGMTMELDRITGNLTRVRGWVEANGVHISNCSPINKSQAEALLQQQIDRRDEIIKENEARRLF